MTRDALAALSMGLDAADRVQAWAHRMVREAVLRAELPALDGSIGCAECGKPAVEYDHREYARPLDVAPVCHRCNIKRGPAVEFQQFDRVANRCRRPQLLTELAMHVGMGLPTGVSAGTALGLPYIRIHQRMSAKDLLSYVELARATLEQLDRQEVAR